MPYNLLTVWLLLSTQVDVPVDVAARSAITGALIGSETFQAVLDPHHKTKLYTEVDQPVKKINKKMGQTFQKGEVLIEIDDVVAKSDYFKALSKIKQSLAELEAVSELHKSNLASSFELRKAESELASAKADLSLAKHRLESTKIVAPYDGIVDTVQIEAHEMTQRSKELINILDDNTLIAKLLIPSSLLKNVKVGTPLYIKVDETGKIVEAKLTRIGGMIDPSSSTIRVEAEIDNENHALKAGMSGTASFSREFVQ
jgi:RND family efflux transporter MFP subunit